MNHIKEQILERTDGGLLVFNYYMPFPFKPKKKFQNPLYEDKRASCYIYKVAKTGVYRMNDFGDPNYSGDCFWFVAAMMRILRYYGCLSIKMPMSVMPFSSGSL